MENTSQGMVKKRLNDLDGKEWIKHSISWFSLNPTNRDEKQIKHPGKFPSKLAERFIELFTKKGEWVLDPFLGVGSTLMATEELERRGIGIELNPDFVKLARQYVHQDERTHILQGNALEVDNVLGRLNSVPQFSLVVTSPPYWNMLGTSRGGSKSQHKERIEKKLPEVYSHDSDDLGNITDYMKFLDSLELVFSKLKPYIRLGGHLVVVLQNIRTKDQEVKPLAWDFAARMAQHYQLQQEQIWCQTDKRAGIWGYPTTYVSSVHHHYCLIFRNDDMSPKN